MTATKATHPDHRSILVTAAYPITVEAHTHTDRGIAYRLVGTADSPQGVEALTRMTLRDADTPMNELPWDIDARGVVVIRS